MPTRIIRVGISRRQSRHFNLAKQEFQSLKVNFIANNLHANYLLASSIATATATVIPTMGLLPAPMRPIIST